MAKRRSPGGGLKGVADFSNNLLSMMLQNRMIGRRQADAQAAALAQMREQQSIDTAQSYLPDIRAGKYMPGQLPMEVLARLGGGSSSSGEDLVSTAVSRAQTGQEQPGLEQIREATTQAEVPDIQTLISERASRGPITELGPLTGTLQARKDRLGSIDSAQELEMDRGFAQKRGDAYNTAMGTEMAASENFPSQLNRSTMEFQNETANLTGRASNPDFQGAQKELKQAEAYGSEYGRQDAALTPDFINARVDEYLRSHPDRTGNRVTDAQARAMGFLPLLQSAHEGLKGFENKRVDVALGSGFLSQIPGGGQLLSTDQRSLMQYANSYLNVASLILTGVTARPDEYSRYLSTYVGYHGDDDRSRAQKRLAREFFNEAVRKRAQTGTTATSVSEIMDEVDAQLNAGDNFLGAPPQLDRESIIQQLEQQRSR